MTARSQPYTQHRFLLPSLLPPLLQLLLTDLPQLIHLRGLTRCHAFGKLHKPPDRRSPRYRILRSLGVDLDHEDSRIFRATIMLAIAQVPNPRLQGRTVVFPDNAAVGDE
jgi:hypothetical protein